MKKKSVKNILNRKLVSDFFATCKQVIREPKVMISQLVDDNSFAPHAMFLVILWVVGSVLTLFGRIVFGLILPRIAFPNDFGQILASQLLGIPVATIVGVLVTFIGTAILHVWIKLFRGKGKIVKTFQLNVYSMVPSMLFGWIPVVNIVASAFGIYLTILGVEKLHGFTRKRAIIMIISLYVIAWAIALASGSVVNK